MSQYGSISIWLGGYKDTNGNWVWIDNTTIPSDGWQASQPNGTNPPENCIGYTMGSGNNGWSDFPCESKFNYICQISNPSDPSINMHLIFSYIVVIKYF